MEPEYIASKLTIHYVQIYSSWLWVLQPAEFGRNTCLAPQCTEFRSQLTSPGAKSRGLERGPRDSMGPGVLNLPEQIFKPEYKKSYGGVADSQIAMKTS